VIAKVDKRGPARPGSAVGDRSPLTSSASVRRPGGDGTTMPRTAAEGPWRVCEGEGQTRGGSAGEITGEAATRGIGNRFGATRGAKAAMRFCGRPVSTLDPRGRFSAAKKCQPPLILLQLHRALSAAGVPGKVVGDDGE
jgi:hypothetical protein